ncbi:MAG: efflux transporter outer membrane subunit [Burkholderiaceae bacterium]
MPRHLAVSAAALLTAACSSMAPRHERPPLPVAAAYPQTADADRSGAAVAELGWREVFTDARLRALIEIALQNNRDLRAAAATVEQAGARAQAQAASLWPTLGAGLAASRQATASGHAVTTYSAGLQMPSYEVDFFGRLRSLTDAAQAQALAAEEGRRTVHIALVAAVAATHLALLADNELLALTQRTLDTRVESLRLVRLRYDSGTASELDLQQALSLVASARATLAAGQRQRALDDNALVLLLGQPQPAELPAPTTLAAWSAGTALPAGLPSALLERRPDIRAAEAQLVAAEASLGAARAAFFPQVTLTASAGTISSELAGLFKSGSWGFSAAGQLLATLFDAGRNRANQQVAEAGIRIAAAQYDKAVQSAFREVTDALAGRATLGEQLDALKQQEKADAERLRIAELRFANGVASSLDVLDAQRSLFATQQQVLQAQLAQVQNQVALYKVLGGGWLSASNQAARP